jgi:CheY-like chemotaxis protein
VAESLPFEVDEDDGSGESAKASSVLVVDDEWLVLDVFKRLLGKEGDLAVETAESGEAAVRRIKEKKFDLLITDKNLPGMGGLELIYKARALQPAMEAVMITGYANSESLLEALAVGASDYLTKPFDDLKVVRAKIRAALERRVQKTRGREKTRALAKDAQAMLAKGRGAQDTAWDQLDKEFAAYEQQIKRGGDGYVLVKGRLEAVSTLASEGVKAYREGDLAPGLPVAVLVLDTSHPTWREDAEAAMAKPDCDVLLLAGPDAGLSDLLEALSMHLELVGFGLSSEAGMTALPTRVRALLMQRAVQRAQTNLARALETFRAALGK